MPTPPLSPFPSLMPELPTVTAASAAVDVAVGFARFPPALPPRWTLAEFVEEAAASAALCAALCSPSLHHSSARTLRLSLAAATPLVSGG